MTTNVPRPTFGANGFVLPSESSVLAGVQADQNAAFGGDLNPSLSTPQGQIAQSQTAAIADANDQFLALANGLDPAYATGRMQEAIGRLYFMQRNSAQPTTVTCVCIGIAGTIIPVGAQAQDTAGNIYLCTQQATITVSGNVTTTFANQKTGPIRCPANSLKSIYKAINGWDSINNPTAGVIGNDVESRADFEYRRQNSVASNSYGWAKAVQGAVFDVTNVLDVYVIDNGDNTPSGCSFTGDISGGVLNVTAISQGELKLGQLVRGAGVIPGTVITSAGGGGLGSYNINIAQTVASTAMTSAIGGVILDPNSIYVAAYGGDSTAIANAILKKKSPGCNYTGNTTVAIQDTSIYSPPYPTYTVKFQRPTTVAVSFYVSILNSSLVPADATQKIQNAIIAAFTGADGGTKARIGSELIASRFYAGVASLGAWASINAIQIGIGAATQTTLQVGIDQVPVIDAANITVVYV